MRTKIIILSIIFIFASTTIILGGQTGTIFDPKVIVKNKVRYSGWGISDNGYVIPNKGYKIIVAFIHIVKPGKALSKNDINWTLKDSGGKTYTSVGFGFPTNKDPFDMVGQLESGELVNIKGASNPLVGLIFIVPNTLSTFSLIDSNGKSFKTRIDSSWLPKKENTAYGFGVRGSVRSPIKGDNWQIGG